MQMYMIDQIDWNRNILKLCFIYPWIKYCFIQHMDLYIYIFQFDNSSLISFTFIYIHHLLQSYLKHNLSKKIILLSF